MTESPLTLGIDIGSKNIRMVLAETRYSDRDFPRVVSVARNNSEGIRHGYVTHPHDVTESILGAMRIIEKHVSSPVQSAYITIGSVSIQSSKVHTDIDIVNPDMIIRDSHISTSLSRVEQVFYDATRNKKILHIFPSGWELDGSKVLGNPIGMQGRTLSCTATVVHVLEHHYDDLVIATEKAGIRVDGVIATPIAESFSVLSKQDRIAGCALVNIGSETVSVSVYENDTLISLAIFPIGSVNITHDIALGFQIPIPQANEIKHGTYEGPISKKKLTDIIEARTEDIWELIKNHLKSLSRDVLLPGGIIITGGGGMLSGITQMAKNSLELPVRIVTPESVFKNSKRELDQSWFPAFGLCFISGVKTTDTPIAPPKNIKKIAHEAKGGFKKFLEQFIP